MAWDVGLRIKDRAFVIWSLGYVALGPKKGAQGPNWGYRAFLDQG